MTRRRRLLEASRARSRDIDLRDHVRKVETIVRRAKGERRP